jgi:hypothetical protein
MARHGATLRYVLSFSMIRISFFAYMFRFLDCHYDFFPIFSIFYVLFSIPSLDIDIHYLFNRQGAEFITAAIAYYASINSDFPVYNETYVSACSIPWAGTCVQLVEVAQMQARYLFHYLFISRILFY